jgi:hypothetical protein
MSGPLEEFVAAAPRWQRAGTRALVALARRPRGIALLRRISPADHAAAGMTAMAHYDDPSHARELGWDADAVVARGRALRRAEGRP